MFAKLKLNVALVVTVLALVTLTVTAPYTNMFGKRYKNDLNYSCCKGDQLYVHHYYTTHLFWVEVGSGYTVEAVGNPVPGGCNIQCSE
jgi:hypothetical protein